MHWEDRGFLLSKRKFRENGSIINVFTEKYGRVSGIVYGGNSRKIRNYLQISNKIFIFYNSKNVNKIGYFKTELIEPVAPKYFDDKKKTSALLSLSSILNILLPESQPNKNIYRSLSDLLNHFNREDWALLYAFWELNLVKELGFDPNLKNLNTDKINENLIISYKVDGVTYKIPSLFVTKKIPSTIDNKLIKQSLFFTRSILLNKFFLPNNINFPKSRVILENYFN